MKFKLSSLIKIGAFVVPIVPASKMAHNVFLASGALEGWGESSTFVLILAFCGGLAFELIGIGSGHMMVKFFNRDWNFFAVSLFSMLVYVTVGLIELGFTTFGMFLIIGPFVYVLSGVQEYAELMEEEDKEALEFKRQERRKDNEARRAKKYGAQSESSPAASPKPIRNMKKAELTPERIDGLRTMSLNDFRTAFGPISRTSFYDWKKEFWPEGEKVKA